MNADSISRLTESQRAYLRLVFQHQSSKQIAQRFGISAHTVDKRIKEAMRILDVASRVEAAQLLAASETGHSLGTQSPDLAIRPVSGASGAGEKREGDAGATSSGVMVGEEQLAFRTRALDHPFPLPFPTLVRPENNLSIIQRLGWTIGLIIGLALATGILLSGLTALGTLLIALRG
ncbi:helix-turn-helix transcriptional regulator [Sphingomonadaceae bacterium G21617-S1]|jgi:DNA-binding CsgD family transcriptional regulator|uniref:helix-turn-helix domain-containing protein n=1 Tax=Rhizorhabdus sp. TaxID=1968843 RepID=UPI0012299D94|nr:helix-turn-helix transcriptional regulator [Rhizorhabdus sp.]MBD3760091.1 helix-turn-helix transcriptional regulator [Rhizorhabdus sp.]MCZ4341363.1 helix-turn-helix transcriptional regulator [Sphingomonadaceae bacterium G21617-S1]TAK06458.1 MAG: LuxR family transcriptional regulator [Rhizorhabdus sp.]